MSNLFPSIPSKILKTDVLSTDSSFKLRDIVWYTGSDDVDVDLTTADFGGTGYGVFEPRTASQEFFTWDTTTIANATTSGITILLRGLIPGSAYTTEASTRKFFHGTGSKVLLYTNAPAFYNTFTNKANTETVTGVWTFSGTPVISNAPSGNTDAANKAYVDGVAVAGASNANETTKGIVELATSSETAAGTSAGGTGARLVPPNSLLKSTSAGAGSAGVVPVADTNGVIDQTFLDYARTWTTTQTFSAATVQLIVPTGSVIPFAGLVATPPTGWLACNGAAVSRSTYANLFAALTPTIGTFTVTIAAPGVATLTSHGLATGDAVYLTTTGALPTGLSANTRYWVTKIDADTFKFATTLANALASTNITTTGSQSGTHTAKNCPYGVGDGSTTFNLPSLASNVPVGKDTTATEFAGLGQTGGEKTHVLTVAELAAHTHTINEGTAVGTDLTRAKTADATLSGTQTTSSAGSDTAHNNLQPYITLNYIIKT